MRGIAVIGTGPERATALVAAAVCAAEERPRALLAAGAGSGAEPAAAALAGACGLPVDEVAPHLLPVEATALVAARHAGQSLDPAALAERLRERDGFAVLAAGGGVLAPLTPRWSVRDLAVEAGLPVVLAVPAAPRAAADGLVALEALRGAGLAVAAVVLAGWPDPPPRVLLDERQLLAEAGGVPVEVLGEDGTPEPPFPVAAWAEGAARSAPRAAPEAPAAPARVTLEPYRSWEPRPLGDPRATPRPELMRALYDVVEAEGPIRASRAYGLLLKAGGGKKLTSVARAPLSSAAYWLANERKVLLTREADIPWQGDDLLRLPDTPPVRVRELGPRTLEEVPLDEVAALATRLGLHLDDAALKRALLGAYGLIRLTARADGYLQAALDLARKDPS